MCSRIGGGPAETVVSKLTHGVGIRGGELERRLNSRVVKPRANRHFEIADEELFRKLDGDPADALAETRLEPRSPRRRSVRPHGGEFTFEG
jgi:hypothetical protein